MWSIPIVTNLQEINYLCFLLVDRTGVRGPHSGFPPGTGPEGVHIQSECGQVAGLTAPGAVETALDVLSLPYGLYR